MKLFKRLCRLAPVAVALFLLIGRSILADGGFSHQIQTTFFGSSGSNVKDISTSYCCGGTLGSLVTDGFKNYILSNNHVLARSGSGRAGDDISQPGLIDNGCYVPTNIVADLTAYPALGRVDAATAALRPGMMDETGYILEIGIPSRVIVAPSVGLAVAKSGRTTGLTTGTISVIGATVTVQYQKGCGVGSLFTKTYSNQVIVGSSGFSDAGDSGSLIVTNNACHQPVGLLFAGNSSITVANPIGDVLTQVGSKLRKTMSFVGTSCTSTTTSPASTDSLVGLVHWPSQEAVDYATQVLNERLDDLMSRAGVIGVGIGASDLDPTEATVVVFIDRSTTIIPELPQRFGNVPIKVVYTDPFVAR